MRCLERDPRVRPASVAQLAIALPGGDPLAAAIAAGETPSPEMVAASGLKEGLRPAIGIALVAFIIAGSIGIAWLRDRTELLQRVPGNKSCDVLIERAQEIIRKAGYTDPPADSAIDHGVGAAFRYLEDSGKDASRWKNLKDLNPVLFVYRQSPRLFERLSPLANPGPTGVRRSTDTVFGRSLTEPGHGRAPPILSGYSRTNRIGGHSGNFTGLELAVLGCRTGIFGMEGRGTATDTAVLCGPKGRMARIFIEFAGPASTR